MVHPVDFPIGLHDVPEGIVPRVYCIAPSTRNLSRHGAARPVKSGSIRALRGKPVGLHPLSDHLIAVNKFHGEIPCPMKDDSWHNPGKPAHSAVCLLSLLHRIGTSLEEHSQ